MKKIKLFILLVVCLMVMPVVHAASANTVITGTDSVRVGKTTNIYIKVNSSANIEGVDVTYSTSGNITVTNVSVAKGFTQMGQQGNRYILYAMNPVKSGSTVLTLTVKGTAVGKGTVTVNNLEATVSGETAIGGSKSYEIAVNPAKTQTVIENKQPEKQEDDSKVLIEAATELVEKAEKSLLEADYNEALNKVNALADGDEKTELLNRLTEVKIKMAVNKECANQEPIKCETCKDTNDDAKPWIILSIILIISLIAETIYLVYTKTKNED